MRSVLRTIIIRLFIVGAFVFSIAQSYSYGQSSEEKLSEYSPRQLKKLAAKCELRGDYYTALGFMEEAFIKDNENPKTIYYLADLYRKSKNYDSAIVFYSNPIIDNDKKFPLRKYHLGCMQMINMEYEDARKNFSVFRKTYKAKDVKQYKKLSRNFMIGCDSALVADTNQLTAYIYNLGSHVNSEHIEFSPYPISKDEIIYGTLPIDSANIFLHSENNAPVRQLLLAKKNGKTWQSIGVPEWEINDPEYNIGNAAISPDGKRMYFTRCKQNWKFQTICHICKMEKVGEVWSKPHLLNNEINSENYTVTHPAIGTNPKDGSDILYFVSDRPGGKGGYDIWYSLLDRKKKIFKTPKNLGSKINTFGNEITPHFNSVTQSLYYSSDGLPGYGGFDVYRSEGWGRKWGERQNVGTPINSSYNDQYLAMNTDGNTGFFTSNRPGSRKLSSNTCCDDIYYFNWKLPQTIPSKGMVVHRSNEELINLLRSKFDVEIESIPDGSPLNNIPVYLYLLSNNGEKRLVQTTKTINGWYELNMDRDKDYLITVRNYGYSDKTFEATTRNYITEDTLDLGKIAIPYVPDVEFTFNVYYESAKSNLGKENEYLLDTTVLFLLELLPSAIIEIGAHTDDVGSEEYNKGLSQERAESVVKYLTVKGIHPERLVAKGYGMEQPIAPNKNADGTDNPEGRRQNRRTQIKIIGTLAPEGDIEE